MSEENQEVDRRAKLAELFDAAEQGEDLAEHIDTHEVVEDDDSIENEVAAPAGKELVEATDAVEEVATETATEAPVEKTEETTEREGNAYRVPNSWKADAREIYKDLPEVARREIDRREREHERLMQQTAQDRKISGEFQQAMSRHANELRSMNIAPAQLFEGVLDDLAALRDTSNPQRQARIIAELVKTNRVDLSTLDSALAGNMQAAPQPQVQFDPSTVQRTVREEFEARERYAAQQANMNTVEQFANDPKNEFFNDVMPKMQALLAGRQASSLQEAYDMACYADPDVRAVLTSRQTRTTAPAQEQRKLAASSSVRASSGPRTNVPTQTANNGQSDRRALLSKLMNETASKRV